MIRSRSKEEEKREVREKRDVKKEMGSREKITSEPVT